MTEYFDHCEQFRVPAVLHRFALHYILKEFHSNPNIESINYPDEFIDGSGENILQILFDKSPIKMRMYGSAKELLENLKILMNFPGCHRNFIPVFIPYSRTPTIYESLKNEKFICKSDLFPMLQSMIIRLFSESKPSVGSMLVILFLKSKEKPLFGNDEFVRFDQKIIDEIWKEIQGALKEVLHIYCHESFKKLEKELTGLNTDQLFAKLKDHITNAWDAEVMESVRQYLEMENMPHGIAPEMMPSTLAMLFTMARILIRNIQGIIEKRPEMFLPRKGQITVRLFEDNGQQFVMRNELFDALKKQIPINYTAETQKFGTIKWEDVLKQYGNKIKKIEFIRYPITRSKHKATPINVTDPLSEMHSCLPAVDVLLEFLRTLIFELKVFQKYANPDFVLFKQMFTGFAQFFDPLQNFYFVKSDAVRYLASTLDLARKTSPDIETMLTKPAKEVRNAKADGFTLQNLKNELAHLGLTETFPEIQDYAEVVYEQVNRVKKERYLRTCDLFDAIENCQLICIFERMPNLKKFLHNQGGCGRVVGLKCEMCMNQQKASEDQKPSVPSKVDSDVQKPPKLEAPDSKVSADTATESTESTDSAKKEMEEKLTKLEKELLQKTKESQEISMANIKLTAESETKSGKIEKLMDKLSIGSSSKSSVLELN